MQKGRNAETFSLPILNRYTSKHNLVLKVNFNTIKTQIDLNNIEKKPLNIPTRNFLIFMHSGQRIHFKQNNNKPVPMKSGAAIGM